jgi:heme/copper-type cytochrome/quinol oxidase subunit 2
MTLKQRIIKITTITLTIGIVSFLAFYSVIMIHNTEDPHFAKKVALTSMAIILLSIISGGYVLYKLKGD